MKARQDLIVLQLNDSHAYFEPHQELFWSGDHAEYRLAGGYGRIATVVKEARRERPGGVLFCDCGDTMHGTYPAVVTKGEAMVPVLNAIGLDAMAAHWEFAYGPAQFRRLAGQLNFPVLGINTYDKETGELAFAPYTVVEAGGVRIGVVGLGSNIVDKTMPPPFSEGLRFTLGQERLPGTIDKLRREEGAELIVVISHLGFPQDHKMAGQVPGIDVLLSGHTHNRLYRPVVVNETLIIQSGCHGSFLGRLDLTLDSGKVVDYRHHLIPIGAELPEDPALHEIVEQAVGPHRDRLSEVVATTATALNRNTVLEATMDNFLLQALLRLTGAKLAFSNGWRYGAPVAPGPLTLNDLYNMVPMDPPVSTVQLTGQEVWDMLEENLEHTLARDPYDQMGGYLKRCLGLNLYFKAENPKGQRIQQLFVGGQPMQPEREYSAVFVTTQGVPPRYGTARQEVGVGAVEALRLYLADGRPLHAELKGTVVAI